MAEKIGAEVGDDAKLYRNTASNASPTWVECEGVVDLTLGDAWGDADVSSRASDFTLTRKNRRTVSADFNMCVDLDDVDYVAMLTSYNSKSAAMQVMILNGSNATTGNRGVKAWCQVFKHEVSQPLSGPQMAAISIKPTKYYDTSVLVPPTAVTMP